MDTFLPSTRWPQFAPGFRNVGSNLVCISTAKARVLHLFSNVLHSQPIGVIAACSYRNAPTLDEFVRNIHVHGGDKNGELEVSFLPLFRITCQSCMKAHQSF